MRVCMIGAGAYGTAISAHLQRVDADLIVWARRMAPLTWVKANGIEHTTDLGEALGGADGVILAIPAQALRGVLEQMKPNLPGGAALVCLAKGIEAARLATMSEVCRDVLGKRTYAVLSGPSFAADIVEGHPVGLTLACKDLKLAKRLQEAWGREAFDIKVTDDVTGVELGGALKNVFAIGAGILDGIDVGESMAGDWFTRCMVEMREVGQVLGGRWETFGGRSGLGDLAITCTAGSRNFRFGRAFATTGNLQEALGEVGAVVEGVKTLEAVHRITQERRMMTPIIHTLHRTVIDGEIEASAFLDETRRLDRQRRREGASTGSVLMRRLLPRLWYRRR